MHTITKTGTTVRLWQAPVIAAQALWVRSTRVTPPRASGPAHGTVPGGGQPIFRLAVVGDSTAAGVGVDRHDQGVAGIFARTMAERLQRDVEWSANGAVHATLRKIRDQVIPSLPEDLDLVVLLAGVADALYGESLEDWSIDIAAAIEDLAVRHRHVIVAGMPPLKDFPVLPRALAAFLDERGREMDAETARVCAGRGNVTFASSRGPYRIRRELFASDGLHLSEAGYVAWANFLARQVPWM